MSFIRVQATIPHATGLPEDAVTNSFAIRPAGANTRQQAADAFHTELIAFYTAVKANLSAQYGWANIQTEFVDLLDDKPRLPFSTQTGSVGSFVSTLFDLPAEVAICCTLTATINSGDNPRRRRGRFYLGPLQNGSADLPLVPASLVSTVATALGALIVNPTYTMCVYSRYTHHGVPVGENIKDYPDEIPDALPSSFSDVSAGWVDNAWDTVRRRGVKATSRTYTG